MKVVTEIRPRTYGEDLAEVRLSKYWSQKRLADEARIHINTVYRVEAEETKPSPIVQRKLAEALGVDRHELWRRLPAS